MLTDKYFGSYERFSTSSKKEATVLLNADNLVGDQYDIVFKTEDNVSIAWLRNRFGTEIGYFDKAFSRRLSIMAARGWKLNAFLSYVAYSDIPEPGEYWGEMAVICYDPSLDEPMSVFMGDFAKQLISEKRVLLKLNNNELQNILSNGGHWLPSTAVKLPKLKKGNAYVKTKRSFTETMVEQGRKRNIGCYVISWLFILGIIGFFLFCLKSCGLF